jgi:hypothetical protein
MTSEYFFGGGSGHLPFTKVERIAQRHDAALVNYTEPTGEKRHWFATRNYGTPFNEATAKAVVGDLKKAGLA